VLHGYEDGRAGIESGHVSYWCVGGWCAEASAERGVGTTDIYKVGQNQRCVRICNVSSQYFQQDIEPAAAALDLEHTHAHTHALYKGAHPSPAARAPGGAAATPAGAALYLEPTHAHAHTHTIQTRTPLTCCMSPGCCCCSACSSCVLLPLLLTMLPPLLPPPLTPPPPAAAANAPPLELAPTAVMWA
jgi:hypothetical protein